MRKNGFTLIELLAVIVILAIIALIATPAVLNIIEDSRKSAAEASARNIISAAKTYYMSETMNGRTPGNIDLSGTTLKYDGDQATKGTITFTDGKASGKMYVGGYCVEVAVNGKVTSEKKTEDECEITETPSEPEVTYTKYNDGTPLLYDPVNNVKCIDTEVATNVTEYGNLNKDSIGNPTITGLKDGCMKWYAFLDSEDSSTVNLILDHNTTANVAWNSDSAGTTPVTALAQLSTDITNWNAEVKSTARLISASEVNQIAPLTPFSYDFGGYGTVKDVDEWVQSDYNTWYFFHTGTQTEYEGAAGSNTYAWLFDNTNSCTQYGCNVADSGTTGYWTSSFVSSGDVWSVSCNGGRLDIGDVDYRYGSGVRPVITVSKSIFY